MSAPAISGTETFCNIDITKASGKFTFFSTLNTEDIILNKFHILGAKRYGKTTLGTKPLDAIETKRLLNNSELYNFGLVYPQKKHDLYYYFVHKEYRNYLFKFFNEK
jgi:hypothetical protein